MGTQLDLFVDTKKDDNVRLKLIEEKVDRVKTSTDNVRKGLFARHGVLSKLYMELKEIIDGQALEIKALKERLGYGTIYEYHQGEHLFIIKDESREDEPAAKIAAG